MMHEIELNGYEAALVGERYLMFGTRGSYGIEQLHITAGEAWDGLDITATFCPPGEEPVRMLLGEDGCIDVPPEATAKATSIATGRIVFSGINDGVCRISLDVPYYVRDHSETNGKESEGITPSVIDQIIAETRGDRVAAAESASAADKSAVDAAASAKAAEDAANAALTAKQETEQAAADALQSIAEAETSAVQAVENTGREQSEAVAAAGDTQIGRINTASDTALKNIADTKAGALAEVTTEGGKQIGLIGDTAVGALDDIKSAKDGALTEISAEGQTQKSTVAAEGEKQLEAVTKKAATAEAAAKRAEDAAQSFGVGVHRYGALWDGINSACTRLYNAEGKTAAAHMGTFDAGIVNDFDNIYPWSEMRLCNWIPGTATEKAKITAFEGEPGYDASANLGAYRPEFWYSIEPQTGGGILFVVADGKLPGYHYSPPYMLTSCFVANDGSGGLQCKSGDIQCDSVSLNNYNTMNAAQGMLTEDYWADGAEKLLLTVEFAEMNSQKVTGNGFTGARYNENDVAQKTEAAANSVVVLATAASNFVAGSQTIGLGTSLGGNQKMKHRKLIEIADYEGDATLKRLVFDGAPVDVAQGDIVYSTSAVFDGAPVGHGSGYVGANGKAISYYRGAALQTGAYMWIANILRASDETVWVAPSDATQTGAIGEDWINTGLTLPTAEGTVKHLAVSKKCPLVIQPDAVGNGATTTAPVGDYFYRPRAGDGVTALLSRGNFANGSNAGAWYGSWWYTPSNASWNWASQLLSYWGTLKQCDSYNFRRTRFDTFVSISHCKEVMKNVHNRRRCTSGGV